MVQDELCQSPEFPGGHLESLSNGAPEVYLLRSTLRKGAAGEISQLLDIFDPDVHSRLHHTACPIALASQFLTMMFPGKPFDSYLCYMCMVVGTTLESVTITSRRLAQAVFIPFFNGFLGNLRS